MIIELAYIFGFFCLFFSAQVLAAKLTEHKADGVKFNVKLNLVDQTGSVIKSGLVTASFVNLLDRETLSPKGSDDKMARLILVPEITVYGPKVELEDKEKTTSELNLIIPSLQQSYEGDQTYVNFKVGLQDIEATASTGEESSENNEVIIWN
ncbi:MAG: hypothetical protein OES20_18460 [Gammaproteobacteria bacterium]|nr:hypothetical protein [Gammaproteobacteria bacterium]MDH3859305.1 hypothetical protein [Gammaproteobacteria bacterium]